MDLEGYIIDQMKKHPSAEPQDIVKQCYQAAFGVEHLLSDFSRAEKCFEEEWERTQAADVEPAEKISRDIYRINLASWKYKKLPKEWLFSMFTMSASAREDDKELFEKYLEAVENLINQGKVRIERTAWEDYIIRYKASCMEPVRHSDGYRRAETPAYRIVRKDYARLLPILEITARELAKKETCIIVIDGRAASGKTTLARHLQEVLKAGVVHMDDFFLPLNLRTKERLSVPGGNIHYERFAEEIVPNLRKKESFSYKIFDCAKMDYSGARTIEAEEIRIVEGSYSCHPELDDYGDVRVFCDISPKEQLRRIIERGGRVKAVEFEEKWIPLEEEYFAAYGIQGKADVEIGSCEKQVAET
ncbi:MAG: hypothetical protein ACOX75_01245 [Lachnospiraceae bacterium]|jgi:deoxyadenosine/deoxycytidine kinase